MSAKWLPAEPPVSTILRVSIFKSFAWRVSQRSAQRASSTAAGAGETRPSVGKEGNAPVYGFVTADGKTVTLAHSKTVVLLATERHDYRDGCRKHDDCHRAVVARPIAISSLVPDIAAPWTIEVYRAARDPAMEAVAAALSAGK